jgi:hypothetical protein
VPSYDACLGALLDQLPAKPACRALPSGLVEDGLDPATMLAHLPKSCAAARSSRYTTLARLAPRSDGPQDALWKTARACRARPRAAARLVSLLRTGGRSERSPPDCGTRRLFRPRAAAAPGRCLATRRGRGARTPPDAGLNTVIRSSVLSSQCCTRVGRFDPTTVVPAAIGRVGKTVIARAEQVHLAEDPVAHARY